MNSRGIPMCRPSPGCRRHWTLLALLAGWAAGCDLPGQPKTGDRYVPPQEESTFNVLFQQNCVGCHGADGKLGPAPPLNDKLFLALIPDEELQRVIAEGRPGTLMPAFAGPSGGQLTAEQVEVLAEGIKPRWGPAEPAQSAVPPYCSPRSRPDVPGPETKKKASRCSLGLVPLATANTVRVAVRRQRMASRWERSTIRTSWLWSAIRLCAAT